MFRKPQIDHSSLLAIKTVRFLAPPGASSDWRKQKRGVSSLELQAEKQHPRLSVSHETHRKAGQGDGADEIPLGRFEKHPAYALLCASATLGREPADEKGVTPPKIR